MCINTRELGKQYGHGHPFATRTTKLFCIRYTSECTCSIALPSPFLAYFQYLLILYPLPSLPILSSLLTQRLSCFTLPEIITVERSETEPCLRSHTFCQLLSLSEKTPAQTCMADVTAHVQRMLYVIVCCGRD